MARNPFGLSGNKALVTGSSRGLGRGIAQCLLDVGAHFVLNAVKEAGRLAVWPAKAPKNQSRKKRNARPPFLAWLQQFANAWLHLDQISSRWAKTTPFLTIYGNEYVPVDALTSHRSSSPSHR